VKDQALLPNRNAILLTGATGLVGGLLLRRLADENANRIIYALVRRPEATAKVKNTHFVSGDMTQPGLGMREDVYAHMAESIDTIVHCAACTKFTLPLVASRQVNVQGTSNIVELARRCTRLKLLLHVSSTYVAGRKAGPVGETPMTEPDGWFNPYEQSKFEAEQVICDHAIAVPWMIVRLSTIVGNSITGHISQFNYFHQLLRLIPHNPFPLIPGDPRAPVDLVSDDWVTDALFSIVSSDVSSRGSVFHLCAGPSQSLPAQDVLELAFQSHRRREPSSRVPIPSFVTLEEFQAFATTLSRKRGPAFSQMAELVLLYMSHLGVRQAFLNTATKLFLEQRGITPPRTRDFLPRIIESCF
jgi:nucleoside-diphosphate-sugar epimerase